VLDLSKAQRTSGHRVFVVTLSDTQGALAADFREAVDTLDVVPKRAHGVDVTLMMRLSHWFRTHGIDIVHTHNELPLIYGAPAAKLARAVVVHSKHGIVPVTLGAHWLRRAAAIAVDRFVAVSAATAETATANRECSPAKLRVVINGTDLSRFPAPDGAREAVRSELGIPGDARVVITVGRLVKEKNHELLVGAVAPLLREDRRLVIVGDGPLRDPLHALVRSLGVEPFVHLTGSRRDVPALLAGADAFVLSSDSEGLPIGLLEAMAAGLPVISTAVGGIPAVIRHGETGLLIPSGTPNAIQEAASRVFEGDAALASLGNRARAHALGTYSVDRMARDYFSLYQECLVG
jgi:glycosyltransferase involved in cell wall biosynthesis